LDTGSVSKNYSSPDPDHDFLLIQDPEQIYEVLITDPEHWFQIRSIKTNVPDPEV
jgi:hypothetical protein